MAGRNHAAAWRVWRSYRGSGAGTLAFVAARLLILPLGGLDAELRALRGRVLSLGCGHGVLERYLATINPHVEVLGLELDEERVGVIAPTAGRVPRVSIRSQDVTTLEPTERYDAALAVDVLHHISKHAHARIADALHSALELDGTLLLKDIATTPRWRHRFNQWHDRLVTGEFSVDARAPDEMARIFEAAGFRRTAERRIGRFSPYSHYLLVLRRRGDH